MPPETPDTSEFPAQPVPPAPTSPTSQSVGPASRPAPRNRSGLAMVLLALLVVAAVGLGIWLYSAFLAPGEEPVVAAPETSTTEAEPTTGAERTTVTSTASTSTSAETTSSTESSTPTTTEEETTEEETTEPTEAATPMALPAGSEQCAANVNWRIYRATDVTSCGFAEAVAVAMNTNADVHTVHDVQATSPVTGQGYTMRCSPEQNNSYVCRGGDNAVVVLEERAARD